MNRPGNSACAARILLCVHQFFPDYSAGTEVLVLSTAKALQAAGYEVQIVTGALTDSPEASSSVTDFQGFTVYRISTPYVRGQFDAQTVVKEYDNPDTSPAFAAILERYAPDLVHFFHFKNLTLSCLRECFARSIPTVFTPTDYWLTCRTCQLLKPWGEPECAGPQALAGNCLRHILVNTERHALVRAAKVLPGIVFSTLAWLLQSPRLPKATKLQRLATDLKDRKPRIFSHLENIDLLLPPTSSLHATLLAGGIAPKKIQPLRYAIEQPAVNHDVIATSATARPFTVGFIGTLVEHKGCHVLLSALKSVQHRQMDVRIYGSVEHYPAYVQTLKTMVGDDHRVRFCGTFPSADIGNVLSELDVLVIPSTWRENAPLVLLNAVASATPVIASDVVGITEYLDDADDVSLFPPGDSRRLAQLLDERSQTHMDTRSTSRRAARMAGSSLETYASALDSAYTRLIQRPYDNME